jgi:hypothetical protein
VYRFYYSKPLQTILQINIFIILMLAFFENPSSLSASTDISKPSSYTSRYYFRCGILETIDFICLLIFISDALIKTYLIGKKRLLETPWYVYCYHHFIRIIISYKFIKIGLLLILSF